MTFRSCSLTKRRPSNLGPLLLALSLGALPLTTEQDAAPDASGAAFLLVPVGGRATALGQAAVADAGSSEAVFWNPAGLGALDRSEIAIHYASTFASDNTTLTALYVARGLGAVGLTAYLVDFGSQEVVPGPGVPPTGRVSPKNIELLASYGTDIGSTLSVGVNYKFIQFRQDCSGDCGPFRTVVGTTHGLDLGMQYVVGSGGALRIGAAVQHAGFKLQVQNRDQADALPTRVQVGAAYRLPVPQRRDAQPPIDARLLVDLQNTWGEYGTPDARVGLEVGYGEVLKLRSGYAFLEGESSGPSLGIGLRLGRLMIDFARLFFDSTLDDPAYVSVRGQL